MTKSFRRYLGLRYALFALRVKQDPQQDLTGFISGSRNVLIIMPDEYQAAQSALPVVQLLESKLTSGNCTVVATQSAATLVSKHTGVKMIRFTPGDINYFYLPRRMLTDRVSKRQYDLVIDLNIGFVLFAAYLTLKVTSQNRIGFSKQHGDRFYNVQYRFSSAHDRDKIYRSFCSYIENF
jgi:hypothetical protein